MLMILFNRSRAHLIGVFYAIVSVPIVLCQFEEIVETVANIEDPVGLEFGVFQGVSGLFVSSFSLHDVFFYSADQLNRYSPVHHVTPAKIVSGGQSDVNVDGSFEEASFADPSRMAYDSDERVLYVASRLSMTVRAVQFDSRSVRTLSGDGGDALSFALDAVAQYSDFPGMDVQLSNSDLLFVANSKKVYKVQRSDGAFTKTEYQSVNEYLMYKGYPYSTCNIYSIAPDNRNKVLYISVSEAKNVILSVPFDRTNPLEPSYVSVVTGREDHTWSGIGYSFPSIVSSSSDSTVLGMPMHMQFDPTDNLLLWSEGVPLMDGIMAGSLMIRELDLRDPDRTTSVLAGVNAFQSSPISGTMYMGSTGGYVDGVASEAAFKYPISIEYVRSTNGNGVLSPEIYVADRWNNAIRRVSREVYTAPPSITFSPTRSPTISQFPTRWPTRYPSRPPATYVPTRYPSVSPAPTHQFKPTLVPTEPNPPTYTPSSRPSHIHAIFFPTRTPTHVPTIPLPADIRYEDHSAFGGMGFGKDGITGLDIFLATMLGLLLAALLIMCLIMKERADKRREKKKKKMVLRLDDDDDSDDSDDDVFEDPTQPAGDVRRRQSGYVASVFSFFSAAAGYAEAAEVDSPSFSDHGSETSSVHSDTHLIGRSSHSSAGAKSKFGISRFFPKKSSSGSDSSEALGGLSAPKPSDSISSMLQKLKIGKRAVQNADNESFTASTDVIVNAPGSSFDYSSTDSGGGIQMHERPPSRGARSATGMAEGSVTRGGSRRSSGPDYL